MHIYLYRSFCMIFTIGNPPPPPPPKTKSDSAEVELEQERQRCRQSQSECGDLRERLREVRRRMEKVSLSRSSLFVGISHYVLSKLSLF